MKPRACLLGAVVCCLVACAAGPAPSPTVLAPSPVIIVVTATPTPTPEATTYVVAQGDTLSKIARAFGVQVSELAELNGIEDANRIAVGQVLVIPSPTPSATAQPTPTPSVVSPTLTRTPLPPTATPEPRPTRRLTATAKPTNTELPTATATVRATDTPAPAATATKRATSTPRATGTAAVSRTPTLTATPTASATVAARPTFAPTPTFRPRPTATKAVTRTARPTPRASATAAATAAPTASVTATPPAEGAHINLTPEDEALAAAMQAAMAQYGVKRVVIADARDQGGARIAIGTVFLTEEQEESDQELTLPLGGMFIAAYRVAALVEDQADLDSIAIVVATSEGNATALIAVQLPDVAAYLDGGLSEEDFVRRWVVRDF